MSTTTKNLKLIKPELSDPANITITNENWDILDTHTHDASDVSGILSVEQGGTGANTTENALANLFAGGKAVLSSYQYGDELPTAGTVGRIFFKKV